MAFPWTLVWQAPNFNPHRTIDRAFDGGGSAQETGVGNAGTPYPFKPANEAPSNGFGGTRVGQYGHDAYLRLIPFPKPPSTRQFAAASAVGARRNKLGASRSQGPGAPQGGR